MPFMHTALQAPSKQLNHSPFPEFPAGSRRDGEHSPKQPQQWRRRPCSATPAPRRNHVQPPPRPKSAHADNGVQKQFLLGAEQQPDQDDLQYSWMCGNVHGTGHMLGPVVPHPGPCITMQEVPTAHLYCVPPRQPCRAPLRQQRTPGATTSTLLRSTLSLHVLDRLTDLPIPGATVLVVDARSFVEDKSFANLGSTASRNTKADSHGSVRCTVLANHR